jgi:hypothetical protein
VTGVSRVGPGDRTAPAAATRPVRPPAAEAPVALRLPVSRPLGESGASIRSVGTTDSFLRMFLMETSHLPAQLRRAGGMQQVVGRDISLRVMLLPGGVPVAVSGSASTRYRAADGRVAELREAAYVSVLRSFLAVSAPVAAADGLQTAPPIVRTTGSFLSAIQVLGDRAAAARSLPSPPAGQLLAVGTRALSPMAEGLDAVARALAGLEAAFARLADPEVFSGVRAESSSPLFLGASAAAGAEPGTHRIEVLSAARGHAVASARRPDGPLGLTGSFKLNGVTVDVAPGDALFDLGLRINRGEDTNGNGVFDAGEDTDGNWRLDGGTAAHGVRATFTAGRLELRARSAAAGEIQVEDPAGVLAAVGLVAPDGPGRLRFTNELSGPQEAAIRVDGIELRSAEGLFRGALPGLDLEVLGQPAGPVTVTVSADASAALGRLRPAVEEFNSTMRQVNRLLLASGGLLASDPAATRTRAGLVEAVLAPVAGSPEDLDQAAEAGLERAERWRTGLSEEQLAAAARSGPGPLGRARGVPTAFNALYQLGITAEADEALRLDEQRFAGLLLERPGDVAGLFTRAGRGIAARVLDRLGTALGEGGLLQMRRLALVRLGELGLGREFARVLEQGREAALVPAALAAAGAG